MPTQNKFIRMHPQELKKAISSGLLSFPVTHFNNDLGFNKGAYQEHVGWLVQYDAAALFAAGGTGELFLLSPTEIPQVVSTAKEVAGNVPLF